MKKSTMLAVLLLTALVVIVMTAVHVQRHPIDRVAVEDATMAGR